MVSMECRKRVFILFAVIFAIHALVFVWSYESNFTYKTLGTFAILFFLLLSIDFAWSVFANRSSTTNHGDTATPPSPQDFERELKELEVLCKRHELDAKKQKTANQNHWLARWNNPVTLAVLAAIVGYFGTLITWSLAQINEQEQHKRTLNLEETKQRATEKLEDAKQQAMEKAEQTKLVGTIMLDAMKTGDGQKAAANLLLFDEVGLISLKSDTKKKLEDQAGNVAPGLPSPHSAVFNEQMHENIRADVAFAVSVLNTLFDRKESLPGIKPSEFDQNAYYDSHERIVYIPSDSSLYTPDVAYREVAHMYRPLWSPQGEHGALGCSVADVLAWFVTQKRLRQSVETANWVLYRKWISRSLQAPEIGHKDKIVPDDPVFSDVYKNSGIPSKAFYEVASKLGVDPTMTIWTKALLKITTDKPTFSEFARETINQAEPDTRNKVVEAWKSVGVDPSM